MSKVAQNAVVPNFMAHKIDNSKQSDLFSSSSKFQLIPGLTPLEQKKFDDLFAAHYYATGTPFQHSECPLLAAAPKILRPNAVAPNRKRIAGDCLDKAYEHVQKKV